MYVCFSKNWYKYGPDTLIHKTTHTHTNVAKTLWHAVGVNLSHTMEGIPFLQDSPLALQKTYMTESFIPCNISAMCQIMRIKDLWNTQINVTFTESQLQKGWQNYLILTSDSRKLMDRDHFFKMVKHFPFIHFDELRNIKLSTFSITRNYISHREYWDEKATDQLRRQTGN